MQTKCPLKIVAVVDPDTHLISTEDVLIDQDHTAPQEIHQGTNKEQDFLHLIGTTKTLEIVKEAKPPLRETETPNYDAMDAKETTVFKIARLQQLHMHRLSNIINRRQSSGSTNLRFTRYRISSHIKHFH